MKMYFYNGHKNKNFFIDMQRECFVEWKLYEYRLKYIKIMFNFLIYLFKKKTMIFHNFSFAEKVNATKAQ